MVLIIAYLSCFLTLLFIVGKWSDICLGILKVMMVIYVSDCLLSYPILFIVCKSSNTYLGILNDADGCLSGLFSYLLVHSWSVV